MRFFTYSVNETMQLANKVAMNISYGKVLALTGDLGSGKTVFAKGFAKAIWINDSISSPTFQLVSEYTNGRIWLYHIDAYRLNGIKDFVNIGGEDYLSPKKGFTIIEWADLIEDVLDDNAVYINFSRADENFNKRMITIRGIKIVH